MSRRFASPVAARLASLGSHSLLWAVLVFIAALGAYLRSLLPGVVGGDAGELQYAGPLIALTHPTGQPLYVLLGFLWSRLVPLGSMAYRMNLLAAVSAAAACAVAAAVLLRLHAAPIIALAGGLTLAFGATFWGQAVIADKYAFSALLAALVTGLALVWLRMRDHPHGDRWLYALALAYGIGLLHHRSLLAFAPGLAVLVLLAERSQVWRNWRRTLMCLALVLLPPLLVYPIYLPWVRARQLAPLAWQPNTTGDWLDWMLERHVLSGEVLNFDTTGTTSVAERLAAYGQTLLADYTLPVLLVAALGAAVLLWRAPAAGAFLVVTYLLAGGLGANYRGNERQFTYYLPSFVVLIYAYGAGLAALREGLSTPLAGRPRLGRLAAAGAAALILVVPLVQFRQTYPARRLEAVYGAPLDVWRQTLKSGDQGARLARALEDLPAGATLVADWEQVTILWYYQQVEGRRPDLKIVYPIERLGDHAATQERLVLARHLPVGPERHPTNIGALVYLQDRPSSELPAGLTPLGTRLFTATGEPRLELAGYRMDRPVYPAGSYAPLLLTWRSLTRMAEDYSISLRLLDDQGQTRWAQDTSAPVLGMYPTSRWAAGEVVQDYHELAISRDMAAGRYSWVLVVYQQLPDGRFEQLRDQDGNEQIPGAPFEVR